MAAINNNLPTLRIDRPDSLARSIEMPGKPADATAFTGELGRAIASVDKLQVEADEQASRVASGAGNLHEMALSLEKADVAMRLAVRVRNKVVEAYNEIMRMGV